MTTNLVRSGILKDLANFSRVGCTVEWPDADAALTSLPPGSHLLDTLTRALGDHPGTSLRQLVRVATQVRELLPASSGVLVHYTTEADKLAQDTAAGFHLRKHLTISVRSLPPDQGLKSRIKIALPHIHGLRRGRAADAASYWLRVKLRGRVSEETALDAATTHLLPMVIQQLAMPVFDCASQATSLYNIVKTIAGHVVSKADEIVKGMTVDQVVACAGESQVEDTPAVAFAKCGAREGPKASTPGIFIALGSNVGDRLDAIESACRAIDKSGDMRIVRTSCLYETEPMYVEDQSRFLNGVCEVRAKNHSIVRNGKPLTSS
jgi:hypothetical protein